MSCKYRRYVFENPLHASGVSSGVAEVVLTEWCFNYAYRQTTLSDRFIEDIRKRYEVNERLLLWASNTVDDALRSLGIDRNVFDPSGDLRAAFVDVDGPYVLLELTWDD